MIIEIIGGAVVLFFLMGMRIVRPTQESTVETLGKFTAKKTQGFTWIIPLIQSMRKINITEQMVDVQPQMVITRDKLNAEVDAVVYYKVKDVVKALYNVDNHKRQLTSLARTTLRAVMGKMTLADSNENRDKINTRVEEILDKETNSYGVDILRVEIQKIEPPQDVQNSMNKVVKAEQEKIAALDLATAIETQADGKRRATIKEAQGIRQGRILAAEGRAQAIKLVNQSASLYFKGNAQKLKKLEVAESSLKDNSKIILGKDSSNVLKLFDIGK